MNLDWTFTRLREALRAFHQGEVLNRIIFFGDSSLRRALRHFMVERNHQCIENRILQPSNIVAFTRTPIQCRNRLGGMLKYDYREAARITTILNLDHRGLPASRSFNASVSRYPELLRCLDQARIERKDIVSTLVVGHS